MSVRWPQVTALGLAQTVAWASSTYLPAVLAQPLAADLGFAPTRVFAAFSVALLLMAVLGPAVGRAIDRHGGQGVLCASNLVLAAGLGLLGCIDGSAGLFAAWLLIGAGMALGLYDAAFAALVREHGVGARLSITGITLFAGFASTIGWPLSAWLSARWGWRPACFTWAALHLMLALPLNWRFIPSARQLAARPAGEGAVAGPAGAVAFALLYGAGNGMITIAKGMLPLHLFGPAGYGLLQGRLAVAQRLVQAAAPFAFALLLQSAGAATSLTVAAALSLLGLGALFALRSPSATPG